MLVRGFDTFSYYTFFQYRLNGLSLKFKPVIAVNERGANALYQKNKNFIYIRTYSD